MTPRLEAVYFSASPAEPWARLARVLAFTAAEHCPSWARNVRQLPPAPVLPNASSGWSGNTYKLDAWSATVDAAADGEQLLLIDGDTMILRPLDPIWDQPFDVAYTVRAGSRFPLNAGVVFVRVSDPVRVFMRAWRAENHRLLADRAAHLEWRRKYGGVNQAALGSLLESRRWSDVQLAQLPCVEWNCEDTSWAAFDPNVTRIVHVKSTLRRVVLGYARMEDKLKPLVARWRVYDANARADEAIA